MAVDFEKLMSVFREALEEHPPERWDEFVQQAAGADEELCQQARQLLQAHDRGHSLLDKPAVPSPTLDQPITEKPGTQIGPYRLLQQIGEGGMGVVYMAEQKEPVKRRVALKIIKPGMDTRQVIARFEAERQALAMMDHPNIAKVLDAGATESGRPYFVMELVNGLPVTKYCDEQHLTPNERLELFVPICQAVQHAHQKGIIHRDLKPSNILVAMYDNKAVPKIIDFGVAKATSHTLTEKTMFTQLGQVVGTLEYMSPEQAQRNQLDIDTRSDIYSLGVVLYELLTGETPFDRERLRSAAFDEMLRIIREEEPSKPSTKVSSSVSLPSIAANRRIEPTKLGSIIRGELDWIVLKAMDKDRGRRYETANKFAEDVQRYLRDEAVVACPPSAAYRMRKFARRNQGLIVTSSVALAVLITVAIGASIAAVQFENLADKNATLASEKSELADSLKTALSAAQLNLNLATKERDRAEDNLDLALSALDAVYLNAIGDKKLLRDSLAARGDGRKTDPVRRQFSDLEQELLERGLGFYERFALANPETMRALEQSAAAHHRVGLLRAALGHYDAAETAYVASILQFERLTAEQPDNPVYHFGLAQAHADLGHAISEWQTPTAAAVEAATAAIEVALDDALLSRILSLRASCYTRQREHQLAIEDLERAVVIAPRDVHLLRECAYAHKRAGNNAEAERYARRFVATAGSDPYAHITLGDVLVNRYNTLIMGSGGRPNVDLVDDSEAAIAEYSRAIELAPSLGVAYRARGLFLTRIGKYKRALTDINHAIKLVPDDLAILKTRGDINNALGEFNNALADYTRYMERFPLDTGVVLDAAKLHMEAKDWPKAEELLTRAIDADPNTSWNYKRRATVRVHLADYAGALDDLRSSHRLRPGDTDVLWWIRAPQLDEAPNSFRDGLVELGRTTLEKFPKGSEAHANVGAMFTQLRMYDEADAEFARAAELNPRSSDDLWSKWGSSYLDRNMFEEARDKYANAVDSDPQNFNSWGSRGMASLRLRDFETAAADFSEALRLFPTHQGIRTRRAEAYIELGLFKKACDDYRQLLNATPTFLNQYRYALLCLRTDNQLEYRAICLRMLEAAGDTDNADVANVTAWTCSLRGDAVDSYGRAIDLAIRAVDRESESFNYLQTLGAVLYRAGRTNEALDHLSSATQEIEQHEERTSSATVFAAYFLAMTHHSLGHADEAHIWLRTANEWTEQILTNDGERPPWDRRLTLELLRNEARSLIDSAESNSALEADDEQRPTPTLNQ